MLPAYHRRTQCPVHTRCPVYTQRPRTRAGPPLHTQGPVQAHTKGQAWSQDPVPRFWLLFPATLKDKTSFFPVQTRKCCLDTGEAPQARMVRRWIRRESASQDFQRAKRICRAQLRSALPPFVGEARLPRRQLGQQPHSLLPGLSPDLPAQQLQGVWNNKRRTG